MCIYAEHISDRIEKLYVGYCFQKMAIREEDHGNLLPRVYDYTTEPFALTQGRTENTTIIKTTKRKLLSWESSDAQIMELEASDKFSTLTTLFCPVSGYFASLYLSEGQYTIEGKTTLRLADLSTLWTETQVHSSQLSKLDSPYITDVQFSDSPGTLQDSKGTNVRLQTGENTFKSKMTEIGMEDNGRIEILNRFHLGDRGVVSGLIC